MTRQGGTSSSPWPTPTQRLPRAQPGGHRRHSLFDTAYTRMGTVADPQGATLTLSEYRPPATT